MLLLEHGGLSSSWPSITARLTLVSRTRIDPLRDLRAIPGHSARDLALSHYRSRRSRSIASACWRHVIANITACQDAFVRDSLRAAESVSATDRGRRAPRTTRRRARGPRPRRSGPTSPATRPRLSTWWCGPPARSQRVHARAHAAVGPEEPVGHLERGQLLGVEDLALADDQPVAAVAEHDEAWRASRAGLVLEQERRRVLERADPERALDQLHRRGPRAPSPSCPRPCATSGSRRGRSPSRTSR